MRLHSMLMAAAVSLEDPKATQGRRRVFPKLVRWSSGTTTMLTEAVGAESAQVEIYRIEDNAMMDNVYLLALIIMTLWEKGLIGLMGFKMILCFA